MSQQNNKGMKAFHKARSQPSYSTCKQDVKAFVTVSAVYTFPRLLFAACVDISCRPGCSSCLASQQRLWQLSIAWDSDGRRDTVPWVTGTFDMAL